MSHLLSVFKKGAQDFLDDECMSSGAAMAYYTIFSLPPLLVVVFFLAESVGVEPQQIDAVVKKQLGMPVAMSSTDGSENSPAKTTAAGDKTSAPAKDSGERANLRAVAGRASDATPSIASGLGPVSRVIGILLLVFSATGLFAQLQHALNRAWEVAPDPDQGGLKNFLMKRLLSLGMIVVIALLLLVSMVLTTLMEELLHWFQGDGGGPIATFVAIVLNNAAAFLLATVLFAATYRLLPDAKMAWKDVWVGAAITAVLFVAGKAALGWYFETAQVGSQWGSAAASIIGTLVWVYYSSLIVLFGAEVTQAWANEMGSGIRPAPGAVRIREQKQHLRGSGHQAPA